MSPTFAEERTTCIAAAVVDRVELRQVVLARQHLAGALEPVLGERALEPADDRTADAYVRVAPVVRVLGIAGPFPGDADAAGQPDLAVGDEDPAVGAVRRAA